MALLAIARIAAQLTDAVGVDVAIKSLEALALAVMTEKRS